MKLDVVESEVSHSVRARVEIGGGTGLGAESMVGVTCTGIVGGVSGVAGTMASLGFSETT